MRYKGEIFRICEQMQLHDLMTADKFTTIVDNILNILKSEGKEITFEEVAEIVNYYFMVNLGKEIGK